MFLTGEAKGLGDRCVLCGEPRRAEGPPRDNFGGRKVGGQEVGFCGPAQRVRQCLFDLLIKTVTRVAPPLISLSACHVTPLNCPP